MSVRIWRLVPAVLVAWGLCVSEGASSDWPRFRGENGTGIVADKDVPVEFGPNKNLLWKVAIPGKGNSSPIVAKQRIFLQTASEDGKERLLLCLSLKDGKVLWQKSAAGSTAHTHPLNTLASSSAATDDQRVYMPFWDGNDLAVSAFDFDGKHLWTRDLGPYKSQHGAGHSPMVFNGRVFLSVDQDGTSEVVALDAADGKIAWRVPRKASTRSASFSTPLLLERNGQIDVVVTSMIGVSGYDPATGSERWKWEWSSNDRNLRTIGAPIITQGMIFFGGGNGPGDRHTVAIRLDGTGTLPASNAAWERRKLYPYVPSLLTTGAHLFFVNDDGVAACGVAKTGEIAWEKRLGAGKVFSSPLLIDGKIFAINDNGMAFVFAADPKEFKLLQTNDLGEGVRASPAVADNRLLVRGSEHLFCFGKPLTVSAK